MTTKNKAAIAASLTVIKELDATEAQPEATFTVMHLGHPSDAKFGTIEVMTPAEYEKFRWLNTWPKPTLAAQRAIEVSEAERMRGRG